MTIKLKEKKLVYIKIREWSNEAKTKRYDHIIQKEPKYRYKIQEVPKNSLAPFIYEVERKENSKYSESH